jgi:hypothetical protein
MNDGTWMIMLPIYLFVIACPISVYLDARSLQRRGAKITPLLWAVFVLLPPFIGIIIYAALRKTKWKSQTDQSP